MLKVPPSLSGWAMSAGSSMKERSPCCQPQCRRAWRIYGMVALLVAVVVLAAVLPSTLCLQDTKPEPGPGPVTCSEGLARLEKAQQQLRAQVATMGQALAATNRSLSEMLAATNRSLAEARGQWDGYRKDVDVLQRTVLELSQLLSQLQQRGEEQENRAARLQEDTAGLRQELGKQQEQLEDAQRGRGDLQQQIKRLQQQIWNIQSWRSSGAEAMGSSVTVPLSILTLLLAGLLLL